VVIPVLLLLPALMLLLGVCGGGTSESDIEATVEASLEERRAAIPIPTLGANQMLPDDSEAFNAEITRVIDGDTFDVVLADGSLDTVRLLGVDTPERYAQNLPYEYGRITDTVCLDDWGHRATEFAVNALENKSVTLVLDPMAGERGSYGRLLAYVLVDGQDFGSALVTKGYARVYEEGVSGVKQDYLWLQIQAQSELAGLWGCAVAEIVIPAMPPSGGTVTSRTVATATATYLMPRRHMELGV